MKIEEKAYAKLNISLDVSKLREDGYHDMVMVMQTVSLHDDITVTFNKSGEVHSSTSFRFIPDDDRNLAVKAAKCFLSTIGDNETGADIRIKKHIPVGSGMAGGSSDAAAVLRVMNRTADSPLSDEQLLKISEKVGSDVPFCLLGGTALAEGRGEILTPLKDIPECRFVICKPEFSISTPELFKAIDSVKLKAHPDTRGILEAVENNDLKNISRRLYNVFEAVNDRRLKVVAEIKSRLLEAGAEGAAMTGTGSAVYGIFTADASTEAICAELEKEYGFCVESLPVGRFL